MSYKPSDDNALRISDVMAKLYELELREKAKHEKMNSKEEKKNHNCPNCGAPITSYICEYCGTEFEKPKKVLTDNETHDSFASFVREQKMRQIPYYQEWQRQQLLNTLNAYGVNTQIANTVSSLNSSMNQSCNFKDQLNAYHSQINISPYQGPKEKGKLNEEKKSKTADEELVEALAFFMIGMLIFTVFCIIVTVIYNLP